MSITAILGIAFLLIGTFATFLMLHLWGYPYDEATHTSSAPKGLMRLHRLLGYSFVTIYVVMMYFMVPRLWNYVGDLAPRSVAHAIIALGIGITLVIKVSILRFFPHFRQHLPVLGVSLMVMTWLMIGLPLFTLGWEWSLSRNARKPESIARMKEAWRFVAREGEEGWSRIDIPVALDRGRATLHAECIRCHDLNKVLHKERTGEEWRKVVASMTKKARKFSPVTEQQEHSLAMYLTAARGKDPEPTSTAVAPKAGASVPASPAPREAPDANPTPGAAPSQANAAEGTSAVDPTPRVLALLESRCTSCHVGGDAPEGLRLNSLDSLLAGSEDGPVIVAGDPGASELIRRIRGESTPRMPMDGPPYLSDEEIAMVEDWVRSLAPAVAAVPGAPPPTRGVVPAAPNPATAAGAAPTHAPKPTNPSPTPVVVPPVGQGFVNYTHVKSILGQNCVRCHAPQGKMGPAPEGLVLTQLELMLSTAERPVIVPGNPGASLLLRHIQGVETPRMPFDGPPYLDADDIDLITRWIAEGARDPSGNPSPIPVGREVRLRGRLTGLNSIDGVPFLTNSRTEVRDAVPGAAAEVRATIGSDGSLVAERVRGR